VSVAALHKTSIAQLAADTLQDGRLYDARTWSHLLGAYGLDAEDVQRSAAAYFQALLVGGMRDGLPFGAAHAVALGGLLAHGLLWGERLS
jgi:hypothetical protein